MKKMALLLIFLTNLMGCAGFGSISPDDPEELKYNNLIDINVAKTIPDKSKNIIILSDLKPDSLYNLIYYKLVKDGFGIKNYNDKMKNITTEIKYVGSDTYLSANIFVEDDGQTKATVNGLWQYGTATQINTEVVFGVSIPPSLKDIVWSGENWEGNYKPNQAFAYLYKICKSVPHIDLIFK